MLLYFIVKAANLLCLVCKSHFTPSPVGSPAAWAWHASANCSRAWVHGVEWPWAWVGAGARRSLYPSLRDRMSWANALTNLFSEFPETHMDFLPSSSCQDGSVPEY